MTARASWGDLTSFEIRFGVRQECALSPTFFHYIVDWIIDQATQDYSVVKAGFSVHVPDPMFLSSNYRVMPGLFEAVNHYANAVRMHTNTPKDQGDATIRPWRQAPSCPT